MTTPTESDKESPKMESEVVTLSPTRTLIPVGIFCTVLAVPTMYIGSLMAGRLDKLEETTARLSELVTKFDSRLELGALRDSLKTNDRWTGSDMKIFLARLKSMNLNLNVPDCADLLGDDH
jgi:hypothetical protein